jgi:Short C-terminal domain
VGYLILIVIYLAILFAVGKTAENKGRRPFPWIALALVFGIFTFIPLLIAGESRKGRLEQIAAEEELRASLAPPAPATQQLKELGELREAGLLTEEEFAAKKAVLVDRI